MFRKCFNCFPGLEVRLLEIKFIRVTSELVVYITKLLVVLVIKATHSESSDCCNQEVELEPQSLNV